MTVVVTDCHNVTVVVNVVVCGVCAADAMGSLWDVVSLIVSAVDGSYLLVV